MAESFALTEAFYYILLSLYQPLHGYGIMQKAQEFSGGRVRLAVVPFTEIQEAIRDNCPEDIFTVVMRRMMMKLSLIHI